MLLPEQVATPVAADLRALHAVVTSALGVDPAELNLEGACVVGERLRWFQRGRPAAGHPSASVDLDLAALLRHVTHPDGVGAARPPDPRDLRRYDLGEVHGVGLAVTDAVALPDGRVLVSAAAEDAPTAYDDGPVVGSALALLDGDRTLAVAALPSLAGAPPKVEGLALVEWDGDGGLVLGCVDVDDPLRPSALLRLRVTR